MRALSHPISTKQKKSEKKIFDFTCNIQKKRIFAADLIAQWCNGSTTASGSVSLGSNPGWATDTTLNLLKIKLGAFYLPQTCPKE